MWTSRTAPVQTAFLPRDTFANVLEWVPTFVCDRVVDAFFVADVAVNFRSAYRDNETGRLVFEPAEAARRYARSWLLLDVVSIFPFELIMPPAPAATAASASGVGGGGGGGAGGSRLPRLLRLFRLLKMAKILRATRIQKRWEETMSVKYGALRLAKFFASVLILSHWLACGFFFSTQMLREGHESWVTLRQVLLTHCYLYSTLTSAFSFFCSLTPHFLYYLLAAAWVPG